MEVDRYDPEVTYLSTRCCGADTGTPHWVGCRQHLDVNDPASYRNAPLVDDGLLECVVCGREVGRGLDYLLIPENRDEAGEPICEDDWSKIP